MSGLVDLEVGFDNRFMIRLMALTLSSDLSSK